MISGFFYEHCKELQIIVINDAKVGNVKFYFSLNITNATWEQTLMCPRIDNADCFFVRLLGWVSCKTPKV